MPKNRIYSFPFMNCPCKVGGHSIDALFCCAIIFPFVAFIRLINFPQKIVTSSFGPPHLFYGSSSQKGPIKRANVLFKISIQPTSLVHFFCSAICTKTFQKMSSSSAKIQFLAQFLLIGLLLANCNCVFPLEFGMDNNWPQVVGEDMTAGYVLSDQPRVRKLIRPPPLKRATLVSIRDLQPTIVRGWARRNAALLGNVLF